MRIKYVILNLKKRANTESNALCYKLTSRRDYYTLLIKKSGDDWLNNTACWIEFINFKS